MKRRITKTVTCMSMSAVLFFTGVFISPSCAAGASKANNIVMNKKVLNMNIGETFKLKVKKMKPGKLGKAVNYRSVKKNIATVDKRGVVRAKNKGKTSIIVTSKKDKSVKLKLTVNVKEKEKEYDKLNTPAPVNSAKPTETPVPSASPEPIETPTPPAETPGADEGRVFSNIPEMYADMISEQFKIMLPQNGDNIVALDLKDCSSLSDADRQSLADIVSSKYGETVIKTKEELLEEGKIVEDDTHGFKFDGGVLITIKDNKSGSNDFTFDIACTKNGLNAVFFDGCKAFAKEGGWKYELGKKGLS